ncbi:MAG: outer membrane beta-barrel protein [Candidatus Polarisedimenticolia bacterium]
MRLPPRYLPTLRPIRTAARRIVRLTGVTTLFLAGLMVAPPAFAAPPPGTYGFSMDIGIADTSSERFGSDDALLLSFEYQRTGYAALRGSSGFFTVGGKRELTPGAGPRDADAFYVAGDFVLTPRFAMLNPFLMAGVGFYSIRLTDNLGSGQNLEVGINWGAGVDVQVARHFMLGGEISFHHITGEIGSTIRIVSFGGRFIF